VARTADESYQPVTPSPDIASARLAAINRQFAPEEPPAVEHPAITFAKNILNPLNYTDTTPRESGRTGQLGTYNPFEQAQIQGQQLGTNLSNAPVVGGLLHGASSILDQVLQHGSFGGPQYELNAAMKAGDTEAAGNIALNVVAGAAGGLERRGVQAAGKVIPGAVGADQSAIAAKLAAAEKAPLTKLPEQAVADAAGVKSAVDVSTAEGQRASLLKAGFTPQQVDEFAATMAPKVEPKPAIQTAEGQAVDPALLTRSLQTAAGTEGVPLSQNPIFARYGIKGEAGPRDLTKHGGDIGTATRAVMSGDPEAMAVLGPDLTQQLIQNKVAQLVRETGAPDDVVRIGLSVMSSTERATASAAEVVTLGNNAKVVDQVLADVAGPPKAGFLETAEERVRSRTVPGEPPRPPIPPSGGYTPPPSGGAMPPDVPLPKGPPVTRASAGQIAGDVFDEVNALWRGAMAGADVSTVGLQGLPLILKDLTKLPFYAVTGKFGGTQRPYVHSAFGRFFEAMKAGETRIAEITQGFKDEAEALGARVGKDIQISDPLGGISAREELTAGKIIQKVPIIGLVYRQANFATITLLNAMRVGELRNLKRAFDGMQMRWEPDRAGHLANITTGRGDLPFANSEHADAIARWMQRIFFGPRLMTGAVQNVTDTILSLRNISGQIISQPMARKTRLNPVDVARVHTTASFVATGYGVMKLAEASGLTIGTDPEATDFGRITLPGGHRIDFWGPFNEEARLLARELVMAGTTVGSAFGLRPDVKPKYGAKTADQLVYDYLTGKFGPATSAAFSVWHGTNKAGQTPAEVIKSTIANPNPLSNPTSIVPAPFTAQTAAQAFDPTQGGQGGAQGATETALGALGISVLPTSQHINYDGLGRAEGTPRFGQDAIFDEYMKFNPGKLLPAPDSTLGSGKNTFPLPSTERAAYVQAIGDQRRIDLGNLIYSEEYQNANRAQQEKMYSDTKSAADSKANRAFLKNFLGTTTDPTAIRAAAVTGFHAQPSPKDKAYWVASLNAAGKLTADVKQAIEDSDVVSPGKPAAYSVDEYLRAAPLAHEYLRHVPFGTDSKPIGTPADWTAVAKAIEAKSTRANDMVRSGVNPSLADQRAQSEILKSLTSLVQRNLFLNGAQLENPARKQISLKYPWLKHFVSDPKALQETDTSY
jgi:hypothetical protein